MANTPEGKVKDIIKRVFRQFHQELGVELYYHMPVQNGMGAPTLDFIGCLPVLITQDMVGKHIGAYIAVEAKAPGKKPTERQEQTIADIERAGGKVYVYDGSNSDEFHKWLMHPFL